MRNMTKAMQLIFLFSICLFSLWGCQKSELTPAPSVTTYSEPGVTTPVDVLYYEDKATAEGKGKYYIAKLMMRTNHEGIIRFEDADTLELLQAYDVSTEFGIGSPVGTSRNSAFDDFVHNNYTEWCGKVHTNKKGKWQFCTGKDCPGGGICFKHCVFIQGVCEP